MIFLYPASLLSPLPTPASSSSAPLLRSTADRPCRRRGPADVRRLWRLARPMAEYKFCTADGPYRRRVPADVRPLRRLASPMSEHKCSTADRPYGRRRTADVLLYPTSCSSYGLAQKQNSCDDSQVMSFSTLFPHGRMLSRHAVQFFLCLPKHFFRFSCAFFFSVHEAFPFVLALQTFPFLCRSYLVLLRLLHSYSVSLFRSSFRSSINGCCFFLSEATTFFPTVSVVVLRFSSVTFPPSFLPPPTPLLPLLCFARGMT